MLVIPATRILQLQSGVFSLYRRMTPVYFDPAESLAHQLREAGYAEGDIRALIVSHFHADHIAGGSAISATSILFAPAKAGSKPAGCASRRLARLYSRPDPGGFRESSAVYGGFSLGGVARAAGAVRYRITRCRAAKGRLSRCRCRGMRPYRRLYPPTPAGRCWPATPPRSPQSYQTLRGLRAQANLVMDDAVAYTRTLERLNQLWAGGQSTFCCANEGDSRSFMTLWHYFRARRLRLRSCGAGGASGPAARGLARRVLSKSPYFQRFNRRPFAEWPQMDKALMMAQFDWMNTAGLSREAVLACAQRSEADRDFTPKIGATASGCRPAPPGSAACLSSARANSRCGPVACWRRCCRTGCWPASALPCFCGRTIISITA